MPLFKRDPAKKLKKVHQQTLQSAMLAMRRGDVRENARLVAEADQLMREIEELKGGLARHAGRRG